MIRIFTLSTWNVLNRFKLCSQEQNIVSVGFCNRHNKEGLFPQRLFLSNYLITAAPIIYFWWITFLCVSIDLYFCIMGGPYLISTAYKSVKHTYYSAKKYTWNGEHWSSVGIVPGSSNGHTGTFCNSYIQFWNPYVYAIFLRVKLIFHHSCHQTPL